MSILERCLVPFLRAVYPVGHHFVQDNNPKHCSNYGRRFYEYVRSTKPLFNNNIRMS